MHEHRRGLNRALFWLYSGHGRWPNVFRWSMLGFDLVSIVLFLFHPSISWHGEDRLTTGVCAGASSAKAVSAAVMARKSRRMGIGGSFPESDAWMIPVPGPAPA